MFKKRKSENMNAFSAKHRIAERLEELDSANDDIDIYNAVVGVVQEAPLSERLRTAIQETYDVYRPLENLTEEQEEQENRRKSFTPSVAERIAGRGSVDSFFERRVNDRIAVIEQALKEESAARARADQRIAELSSEVQDLKQSVDSLSNKIGIALAQLARVLKRSISRGRSKSRDKVSLDTRVDLTIKTRSEPSPERRSLSKIKNKFRPGR